MITGLAHNNNGWSVRYDWREDWVDKEMRTTLES